MKKFRFNRFFNPLFTMVIVGTLIGGAFTMGLKGVAYSLILAVVLGIIDGIKIVKVHSKPKYGME